MRMRIKVRGIPDVQSNLRQLKINLSNLRGPLENLIKNLQDLIEQEFENEMDPNGKSWIPLTETTLKIRQKRGGNGTNILDETGQLKSSIKISINSNGKGINVSTNVLYWGVQNYGNPDNLLYGKVKAPIPAREFIIKEIPKELVEQFLKDVETYLGVKFKKK